MSMAESPGSIEQTENVVSEEPQPMWANAYSMPHSPNSYFKAIPKVTVKTPRREQTIQDSDPTCLPPITAYRKRTLVLCFDGTGDSFDNDISNIAMIFSMLKKDDKNVQMCYYQAGIGTYVGKHVAIPGSQSVAKVLDLSMAVYLSLHVKEGYEFLMQNYVVGDKICIFGFSRGAYTARALAGMLHKVGLLPADNKQQVPFAWRMFKDTTENGWDLSRQFKKGFCADVTVDFIGVFDTVSSVGFFGRQLPFTSSNFSIRVFRHAMALDERRARFKVNHWAKTKPEDEKTHPEVKKSVRRGHENWEGLGKRNETDAKEVWFAGGHADVGGGNVKNGTVNSLAKIPLRWMVRETFAAKTGILWDIDGLKSIGLDTEYLYPEVRTPPTSAFLKNPSIGRGSQASTTSEPDLEHLDALSPSFDYLNLAKFWWILEFFPAKMKKQVEEHSWKDIYIINRGRGRIAPKTEEGPLVHRTVKHRMLYHEPKYQHKTVLPQDQEPIWVD